MCLFIRYLENIHIKKQKLSLNILKIIFLDRLSYVSLK